jgi:hypothetical protein
MAQRDRRSLDSLDRGFAFTSSKRKKPRAHQGTAAGCVERADREAAAKPSYSAARIAIELPLFGKGWLVPASLRLDSAMKSGHLAHLLFEEWLFFEQFLVRFSVAVPRRQTPGNDGRLMPR